MSYVYILNSLINKDRMYVGVTENLEHRLSEHNSGECKYSSQHKPWKIMSYFYFDDRNKAIAFEKYLKSGSGRSFAKRHF